MSRDEQVSHIRRALDMLTDVLNSKDGPPLGTRYDMYQAMAPLSDYWFNASTKINQETHAQLSKDMEAGKYGRLD